MCICLPPRVSTSCEVCPMAVKFWGLFLKKDHLSFIIVKDPAALHSKDCKKNLILVVVTYPRSKTLRFSMCAELSAGRVYLTAGTESSTCKQNWQLGQRRLINSSCKQTADPHHQKLNFRKCQMFCFPCIFQLTLSCVSVSTREKKDNQYWLCKQTTCEQVSEHTIIESSNPIWVPMSH